MPKMKTDFKGLVKLLAKNLYPEADVFIRELVQNGHDAIQLRRAEERGFGGRIALFTDEQAGTLTFEDDGIGMGEREIEDYLTTIGRTGTGEQTEDLARHNTLVDTIGQFGVGLLSAFVVAERIDIFTRRRDQDTGWHWISTGGEEYQLAAVTGGDQPAVGSRVVVTIGREHHYMLVPDRIRDTIKRYADFLAVPIHLNGEGPVNAVDAPWHRFYPTPKERLKALSAFLNHRYRDIPLHILPIEFKSPRAKGALYISDRHVPDINTTGIIDIFQDRMCVRLGDGELLPSWAKFVRGVVDSPDLQPTAARDNVIRNTAYHRLREALGRLIIDGMTALAREDAQKFNILCDWHHYHLKGMAVHHPDFRDAVLDVLPFETNEGKMTLPAYVGRQRVAPGEKLPVYFFSHGRDSAQFYEVCRARGLIAINTGMQFDEELVRLYAEQRQDRLELKQLDRLDDPLLYERLPDSERQGFFALEAAMKTALTHAGVPHVQPATRRFMPAEMSAVIIEPQRHEAFEKANELFKQPYMIEGMGEIAEDFARKVRELPLDLLINGDNPLIRKLREAPELAAGLHQTLLVGIYNSAVLYSQHRMSPENARVFYRQYQTLMAAVLDLETALAEQRAERERLQAQIYATPATADGGGGAGETGNGATGSGETGDGRTWIRVFVMMPYDDAYKPLERALRNILEQPPYCFELVLARDVTENQRTTNNLRRHISRSDGYLAEMSDLNANVMMEVGWVHFDQALSARPLVPLWCEESTNKFPVDLGDLIRLEYPSLAEPGLTKALTRKLGETMPFQALRERSRERFLSAQVLEKCPISDRPYLGAVQSKFKTVEQVTNASASEFADKAPHRHATAFHSIICDHLSEL